MSGALLTIVLVGKAGFQPDDRVLASSYAKQPKDLRNVISDGKVRQIKSSADLFVGKAGEEQANDIILAIGQHRGIEPPVDDGCCAVATFRANRIKLANAKI